MTDQQLRTEMVTLGRSLFDRGYVAGGSGNLSTRIDADTVLTTPTGSCLGRLDPQTLSVVDREGTLLSGSPPSKEIRFHLALYNNDATCGSVVHLHSTWATLLSCRADINPDMAIRPFTPYFVMKIGQIQLIPYYPPGDAGLAEAMAGWAGKRKAFLLQNHGPIVTGKTLAEAVDGMEEFEEAAKLAYLLRNSEVRYLTAAEIAELTRQ